MKKLMLMLAMHAISLQAHRYVNAYARIVSIINQKKDTLEGHSPEFCVAELHKINAELDAVGLTTKPDRVTGFGMGTFITLGILIGIGGTIAMQQAQPNAAELLQTLANYRASR